VALPNLLSVAVQQRDVAQGVGCGGRAGAAWRMGGAGVGAGAARGAARPLQSGQVISCMSWPRPMRLEAPPARAPCPYVKTAGGARAAPARHAARPCQAARAARLRRQAPSAAPCTCQDFQPAVAVQVRHQHLALHLAHLQRPARARRAPCVQNVHKADAGAHHDLQLGGEQGRVGGEGARGGPWCGVGGGWHSGAQLRQGGKGASPGLAASGAQARRRQRATPPEAPGPSLGGAGAAFPAHPPCRRGPGQRASGARRCGPCRWWHRL
jgi:hypothetical protein